MSYEEVKSFGSRCNICGAFFEDGICSNGHQLGALVEVKTTKKPTTNYQDVKIRNKRDKRKTRKMRF